MAYVTFFFRKCVVAKKGQGCEKEGFKEKERKETLHAAYLSIM